MPYALPMRNNGACSLAGTSNYSESNDLTSAAHLCVFHLDQHVLTSFKMGQLVLKRLTITEKAVAYIEETCCTSTKATTAIWPSDERRSLSMFCQRCCSTKSKSLHEWALHNLHNWMENAKTPVVQTAECPCTHLKTSYLVTTPLAAHQSKVFFACCHLD